MKELLRDERGQGMTEYIIILMLIAIALIGLWRVFGGKLYKHLEGANKEIENLKVDKDVNVENETK